MSTSILVRVRQLLHYRLHKSMRMCHSAALVFETEPTSCMHHCARRFRTLRQANSDLMALCERSEAEMERRRFEMQQFRQDRQNALLVHNSALNEQQRNLEAVRSGLKVSYFDSSCAVQHITL
jgi:hypothetical protein